MSAHSSSTPAAGEFGVGWKVLVGGTVGNFVGIGGLLYFGLPSFVLPLQAQFGWTRTQISFAISCFTLASILALPVVGRACDRLGPRAVILPSIPVAATFIATLAALHGPVWELYLAYFLATLLGAGTLGVTYVNVVAGWFDRRRGLAIGILLAGSGLSAFALPLILTRFIAAYGWRDAWLLLALLMLLQWPIAYFCLRDSPLQRALRSPQHRTDSGPAWEVLLSITFWKMVAPFFLVAITLPGLSVNLVALLVDRRMDVASAAKFAALVGLGMMLARLTIGYLLDRLAARAVGCVVFLGAALGAVGLLQTEAIYNAAGSFLLGFTAGAELDLLGFMSARYFGLRRQGAVFGASLSIFNFGAMLSPAVVGALYRSRSNYDSAIALAVLLSLVGAVIIFTIGPYPAARLTEHTTC